MLYIFTEINETAECTIKEQKAIKIDHTQLKKDQLELRTVKYINSH